MLRTPNSTGGFQTQGAASVHPIQSPPEINGTGRTWTAILGRRDTPTDGVEDYCQFLAEALAKQGLKLSSVRVFWAERGWLSALRSLWTDSAGWRGSWVLLQYTAMAWSRRGFPLGVLAVLAILRGRGVRCAVVFHEPSGQAGRRWVDRFRGKFQDWIVRWLHRGATKAIFADPLEKIEWLPACEPKSVFIPIGANIPEPLPESAAIHDPHVQLKTVAVFCLSDLPNRHRELCDISHAIRFLAQQGLKIRVLFLGRGTEEAKEEIEKLFDISGGEAVNFGLQSASEVSRILSKADAMLCVRGPLFPRRGSAIAGIACGLPIVGYAGAADGTPVQDAGLALVPYLDRQALGRALAHVLADPDTRNELRRRSLLAQREHFSWDVIATKTKETLTDPRQQS